MGEVLKMGVFLDSYQESPLISNPSRNKGEFLVIVKTPKIFPPVVGFFNVLSPFLNVSAHFEVHFFRPSAEKILHGIRGGEFFVRGESW